MVFLQYAVLIIGQTQSASRLSWKELSYRRLPGMFIRLWLRLCAFFFPHYWSDCHLVVLSSWKPFFHLHNKLTVHLRRSLCYCVLFMLLYCVMTSIKTIPNLHLYLRLCVPLSAQKPPFINTEAFFLFFWGNTRNG